MATESKDVELRVRARDFSGKTFDNVTKALDGLEKAQQSQLKSAKAGESSARELEAAYKKIEDAVKALASQGSAIKVFEQQAEALERAKQAADSARVAQTSYSNSLDAAAEKTKKQIAQEEKLAKAVATKDKAQIIAQNRLDAAIGKLNAYGIATDQVAVAQNKIVTAIASGNAALERQAAALDTVDADIRESAKVAAEAAAAKTKAAKDEAAALKIATDAAKEASTRQAKFGLLQQSVEKANYDNAKSQQAVVDGMRLAAQQAEATAKGYQTLARSVKSSTGGTELADQLRNIVDPAAAALKTMDGLGAASDRLSTQIANVNGPVKDFRATLQGLQAIQKNVSGVAAQIDSYRALRTQMLTSYADYKNARAAVAELANQMRAGTGDVQALTSQLAAAQSTLKSTATSYGELATKRRELSASLKAAGVDTSDLASAEQRLVGITNQSVNSINQLSAAYNKHGAAVEGAASKQFKFFSGGRTTLDYTQRLKGELLALATAYVGIQGAIGLATSSLDAFRTSQKIESGLAVAFGGDMKLVREESAYLLATANRIGVAFKDAAPAYAKFSIAARGFGFSLQETRFSFEKLAVASRDAGLSGSEFEGVLKAVEQMLSKGKIQAEELRGQLGDRLPGAFAAAAKGAQMTTEDFSKAMELGNVSAENVINLARELGNRSGASADAAARLASSEAVFQNAVYSFQLALANNGFVDAYSTFLTKLTALIGGPEGAKLAAALSDGFTAVISVLKFLADNIEAVKIGFSLLLGLGVAKVFFGVATSVVALGEALFGVFTVLSRVVPVLLGAGTAATAAGTAATAAGAATLGFRGALLLLVRMIPGIGAVATAIWAAVEAYKYFNKERAVAAKGDGTPGNAKGTGNGAQGSWDAPNTGGASGSWGDTMDPGSGGTASKRAQARIAKEAEDNQKKLDKDRKSAMKKSAKDELDERAGLIKDEYKIRRDAATKEISDETARASAIATINKQEQQALATDKIRFDAENAKSGAAAGEKRVKLAEQVKNELLKIQDDLAKQETAQDKNSTFEERKQTRLDAISHSYDKLKKTIASLSTIDKAGAADASAKLESYIKQLQAVESIKATSDEVKRLDKEIADQQTLRSQGLEAQKALYEAGLISQQEYLRTTAEIQRAGDAAISSAADNLDRFSAAAIAANKGILSATEQSAIALKVALAKAGTADTGNKINDEANKLQMQAIDNLVAKREQADSIFKAQYDLRMITEDEYAAKVNANAEMYKARILEMVNAQILQLQTQRAQGLLDGTLSMERIAALDAQIAKMQLLGTVTANAALQADTFQRALNNALGGAIDSGLNGVVESLTAMAEGTRSVSQGFGDMAKSAASAFASLLLDIAKAIAKQLILNAIAGGVFGGAAAGAAKAAGGVAGVSHAGSVVGRANGRNRKVSPAVFLGAERFHEGGLPGLKASEVPTILQKGEQVLSRDDPDNVLNGGPSRAGSSPGNFRAVIVDDTRNVQAAMASAEGEKVFLVHARKNAATLKQLAGK